MRTSALTVSYEIIAELFLHPDERNESRVVALSRRLADVGSDGGALIKKFLADPGSKSCAEYVQTLELSPPCPLYLGAYLFDEPTSCRGAGTSGRNAYMLELSGLYRHFGFDLTGRELPDYLPAVVEFLGISLEHRARDRIGLRRRFLEHYVLPGLGPLREALAKYHSPYVLLVSALRSTVEEDLRRIGDAPAWEPPAPPPAERSGDRVSLPVLSGFDTTTPKHGMLVGEMEVRP